MWQALSLATDAAEEIEMRKCQMTKPHQPKTQFLHT